MIILDRMIISGVRWVLGKVVDAVDAELDNEDALREELLAAQMKLELGEIDETEFAAVEKQIVARIREIRERRRGGPAPAPGEMTVTGIEAEVLEGHGQGTRE